MTMKKTVVIISVVMSGIGLLTGCYYDNQEDLYPKTTCDVASVTYAGNVLSIIRSNCYSCHNATAQLGNVNLEGYANLKIYSDNGKLAGVIDHQSGFSPMPQGGTKLSDCDIAIIKKWIAGGAGNN